MKWHFRVLSAIGALLLLAAQGAFAQGSNCLPAPPNLIEPGTLTVGISLAAPPTAFMKDDAAAGLDPELMTAIAQAMCLKPKFVNMAFAGLFPALIAKKIDVIHSQVGITDVRKQSFDFVTVFVGGVRLITQANSKLYFNTESDTCGYTTAIMGGSTQMAALERVKDSCPANKPMTLRPFGGQAEAMNEVARGSANAAFVDWAVATYAVAQRPKDFAIASPILSGKGPNTQRNRIGIVFRKGETANVAAVEAAFKRVVQSGAYDAMLAKWSLQEGDLRKVND
ncbi:Solute-binding protein family 3/N-terminal domain-containing protein [Bordetella sputigena]|uniref:transporter substrate-binding domain-containing protein n=1 Tax=Bordetella sputigena TaxID=1416810 RepID=UPI0039F0E136